MRSSILLTAGMIFTATQALPRGCQGTADLVGTYGFAAARTTLVGATSGFTGAFLNATGNVSAAGSGTGTGTGTTSGAITLPSGAFQGIGGAVSGTTSLEPFSRVGIISLTGDGRVQLIGSPGTLPVDVGTYNVYADCSVLMTLGNAFAFPTATTGGTGSGSTAQPTTPRFTSPNTVTFTGVMTRNGDEVEMVQQNGQGARLRLRKTFANRCDDTSLNGPFGFSMDVATASVPTSGAVTFRPAFLSGAIMFNGNGTVGLNPLAAPEAQLTGTYTVNPDCTGTARITSAAAGATPVNVDFVLVRGSQLCNVFGRSLSVNDVELLLSPSGPGIFGSGEALPQ